MAGTNTFIDFCKMFNINPADLADYLNGSTAKQEHDYSLDIRVADSSSYGPYLNANSKLCMRLLDNGDEVLRAYSFIKSDSFVDFVQAVSYAAHQLYKKAQQDAFGEGEM